MEHCIRCSWESVPMKIKIPIRASMVLMILAAVRAAAQEPEQLYDMRQETPPPIRRQARGEQAPSRVCLGTGYLPYSYPAFGSCPCALDQCFPPAPYYRGGKAYSTNWLRKWARAHLGRGSMLEAYACPCIYPTEGRLYLLPR